MGTQTPAPAQAAGPARWRQPLLGLLALGVAVLGAAAWAAPGWLPAPWPLGPLHARCVGSMQIGLALALGRAWRGGDDEALAHAPLQALGAAAGVQALAIGWPGAAAAWIWSAASLAVATAALVAGRARQGIPAPAERPDRGGLIVALLAAAVAVGLALAPERAAAAWPWRMAPAQAAAYAGPFAALAALALSVARERRRYVRRTLVPALAALALGVLAASAWHAAAFADGLAAGRLAPWAWFAAFGALAAWAIAQVAALRERRG